MRIEPEKFKSKRARYDELKNISPKKKNGDTSCYKEVKISTLSTNDKFYRSTKKNPVVWTILQYLTGRPSWYICQSSKSGRIMNLKAGTKVFVNRYKSAL